VKANYFVISFLVLLAACAGNVFTSRGMEWYGTIIIPPWTPSGGFIGLVWTIIFVLSAVSALIFWNKSSRDKRFWLILTLFLLNAGLNVFWSQLFFVRHLIAVALAEMILLWISTVLLMVLLRRISRLAAWLLLPYALWVAFAAYLTYQILILNK
jgi:tryptophan-rich sensory protein